MVHEKKCYKSAPIHKEAPDDPSHRLAAEIIIGAISDWRLLIERRAWEKGGISLHGAGYTTFAELRSFFRSEWCDFLMQFFNIDPARILEQLEKDLQQAIEKDEEEQRREEAERRKKRKGV